MNKHEKTKARKWESRPQRGRHNASDLECEICFLPIDIKTLTKNQGKCDKCVREKVQ